MEGLWGIMTVVAPILLVAAIAFAVITNRRRSAADVARTEAATHERYQQEERAEKSREAADR